MSEIVPAAPKAAPNAVPNLFRLAAVCTFLAVAMGAVVCATRSGASCPTWPGCRPDRITPGWHLNPVIEFSHRVVAVAAGPLVLAAAVLSVRLPRGRRSVRILPWIAVAGAVASGAFGRLVVLSSLPTWLGGVDLFCALGAMTLMGVAAVLAGRPAAVAATPVAAGARRRVGAVAGSNVVVLIAMHVTGIFAAGTGSYTRCMGWPLWRLIADDLHPWLQGVRLGLAGLGAALVVGTAVLAVRTERLRPWGVVLAGLFGAEMALGVVIRLRGIDDGVAAAYSVLAVALLWCLALLAAVAGTARSDTEPAQLAMPEPAMPEPAMLPSDDAVAHLTAG